MKLEIRQVIGNKLSNIVLKYGSGFLNNVVYFGGDIQHFKNIMLQHKDNKIYSDWCFENTADILAKRFPNHNIWIILASNFYLNTYASYDNFFPSDKYGTPLNDSYISNIDNKGFTHLIYLLYNFENSLEYDISIYPKYNLNFKKLPIVSENIKRFVSEQTWKLVGFSKGCIVLNQFFYEISQLKSYIEAFDMFTKYRKVLPNDIKALDGIVIEFFRSLNGMYWLDGGHSGINHPTWVTDINVIDHFVKCIFGKIFLEKGGTFTIEVHVSPYQIKCNSRPWIGKEEALFSQTLEDRINKFNTLNLIMPVQFKRVIHFKDETTSIEKHFQILKTF